MNRALVAGVLLWSALTLALFPTLARSESVTLQLRWLHQFQFAGYYMALELGYYRQAGLEVTLLEGGPQTRWPIDAVVAGQVDFAVTGSGVVIARLDGEPVVAVAAIMQTSPIVWITRAEDGIRSPHDLIDRTVMLKPPPESAELLTVFLQEGLPLDRVTMLPSSYQLEDLLSGRVAAFAGYVSNEPYYLRQQGVEYNLINPRDYGINFYGDVLVTSERLVQQSPDTVARFRDATLQGWEYALSHIDETIELIHRRYAPDKSLEHLRFEAEAIRQLVMPDLVQVGHMNPGRWRYIADSYRELGLTKGEGALDGFLFQREPQVDYGIAVVVALASLCLLAVGGFFLLRFKQLSAALQDSNARLEVLATTDMLTGVKNRHGFFEQARLALSQAQRSGSPVSLLMLDIDLFKGINDQYGHAAGDAALRAFGAALREFGREHDAVGRIGGEEFAMLLVNCGREQAHQVAERLLMYVRGLSIQVPDSDLCFRFTTSIGLVEVSRSLEAAQCRADQALYLAKRRGRDRIEVAEDPATPA
ncbi:GGDEF domain-containing protein [Marinobacter sp. SS21]|uniref:GGDEF domain-containing protein n=1 Tax=Marinobacter sp. SS21 TaxID=2979460 RepID=UPI00232FD6A0|nr:GGDEF domain-containing protein [Marinobacter sp. SS21]MDC0664114.1 ABC transporter substrate-binding protein [Marinobacter sp. SS21]